MGAGVLTGAPWRSLVVVSHWDAHPIDPLVHLLRRLREVPAGAPFEVLAVVNGDGRTPPALPPDLADTPLRLRVNAGYNIGAWDEGWRIGPPVDFLLFLQDECVPERPGWLAAFHAAARRPRTGLVGEAESRFFGWRKLDAMWPEFRRRCEALAPEVGVPPGFDPTHVQMTVLGARREVLEASGGFLTGDDKAGAVAGEILTSVRLRHMGFVNRQVAWLPDTWISHPQWADYARAARRPGWSVRRVLRGAAELVRTEPSLRWGRGPAAMTRESRP